jgi:hypothetical protein
MDDTVRFVTPEHVDPGRIRSHILAYQPKYVANAAVTLCHSDRALRRFKITDQPIATMCKRCAKLLAGTP